MKILFLFFNQFIIFNSFFSYLSELSLITLCILTHHPSFKADVYLVSKLLHIIVYIIYRENYIMFPKFPSLENIKGFNSIFITTIWLLIFKKTEIYTPDSTYFTYFTHTHTETPMNMYMHSDNIWSTK